MAFCPSAFAVDRGRNASQFRAFLELLDHNRCRVWDFFLGFHQNLFPDDFRHHEPHGLVGDLVFGKIARPFGQKPDIFPGVLEAFVLARQREG